MELPKSKRGFLVEGGKFVLRLPLLRLSYMRNHPIGIFPLSVDMNITDRCNFMCKHCRGAMPHYRPKEEIDFAIMAKIIDDMKEMHIPYLTLAGGEPMLRYDFILQTIQYAKPLGIKVGIVTNGSLLNEDKLAELIELGLHRIAFSLDGVDKETHDWIRMPESFDKIMSNLALCLSLKQERNFRLHINAVVMKQNLGQLVEIAHLAKKFNVTVFYQPLGIPQVYPLQDRTLSLSTGVEPFIIKGEQINSLQLEIEKLVDFKKRYGVVGNLIWQLSNILTYYKSLEVGRSLIKFECYAGFNTIHIDSDGEFGSCIFMPSVGNIQNISLKKAWFSEAHNKQLRLIKQCTRPCEFNCYYPISLPALTYEFVYLPVKRQVRLLFHGESKR